MVSGQRIDTVKMVALYPVLQFAGLIAGVRANLEHGDDHDLHRDGFGLGGGRHRWNGH